MATQLQELRQNSAVRNELRGLDAASDTPPPERPPQPDDQRDWQVFAIRALDDTQAQVAQAANDTQTYDAKETQARVDTELRNARHTIVGPMTNLLSRAGLAANLAALSAPATISSTFATAQPLAAWIGIVPVVAGALLLANVRLSAPTVCAVAGHERDNAFHRLARRMHDAATDFRTHDASKSLPALFETARLWHTMLTLNAHLPIEGLKSKLIWFKHLRRAAWIVAGSAIAGLIANEQGSISLAAFATPMALGIGGAALLLLAAARMTGSWLLKCCDEIFAAPHDDEQDPVIKTAAWHATILTQLHRFQAAASGRRGVY